MDLTVNPTLLKFYQYLNNDISSGEFEQWVYINPDLETLLGKDLHLDLIAFPFKTESAKASVKFIVTKYFSWLEFEKWRTIRLLEDIVNEKIDIVLATRKMLELYSEQDEEIKRPFLSITLAKGYESLLDSCPIESEHHLWNDEALKKQLEPVSWYKTPILKLAKQELFLLCISSEKLQDAINNTPDGDKYKKAGKALFMAINDWPTINLSEPADFINELKNDIYINLTIDKIKEYEKKLSVRNDARKMEALSSVKEIYKLDDTKTLDELIIEIVRHY